MKSEKITSESPGATKRRYDDACGAAHALDLVGERWALLVMRELMFGPKRFSDLKADLPGISANVLTQRLEGLERAGIVTRKRLPPPAAGQVYELTPWGYESEPIFQVLGRWAARSPAHDPGLPIGANSILMSLRTMYHPDKAGGETPRIGFVFGRETFVAEVGPDQITVARGPIADVALTFEGEPRGLGAAIYGGVPFDELAAAGMLTVTGDLAMAERFRTWFVLPPKADA
jgi:DNA-binding HxlR family transcriptional regulator